MLCSFTKQSADICFRCIPTHILLEGFQGALMRIGLFRRPYLYSALLPTWRHFSIRLRPRCPVIKTAEIIIYSVSRAWVSVISDGFIEMLVARHERSRMRPHVEHASFDRSGRLMTALLSTRCSPISQYRGSPLFVKVSHDDDMLHYRSIDYCSRGWAAISRNFMTHVPAISSICRRAVDRLSVFRCAQNETKPHTASLNYRPDPALIDSSRWRLALVCHYHLYFATNAAHFAKPFRFTSIIYRTFTNARLGRHLRLDFIYCLA